MTGKKSRQKLELRKLTVLEVSHSYFEDFVREVYDQDYSFSADTLCSDDCAYVFEGITGKLSKYEEEDLKTFVETGEHSNLVEILLKDLCRKELIEKGNYLITVNI